MDHTAPRPIPVSKTMTAARKQDSNDSLDNPIGASHIVNGASTNTSTGITQQPPHRSPPTSGSGLTLRERQQLANSNSSSNGSGGSLTLSITPPKPTYLSIDPQQQLLQRQQQFLAQQQQQNGTMNESQESLGSNLSQSQGQGRRGSFNLSTGSLTFTPGSSSSLASPSSPSYSTIAVARARAAAAAAAGQGVNQAFDSIIATYGDLSESGVFPGVHPSIPYPAGERRQGATPPNSNNAPHPPLSAALSSSNSSLLSNGSASSFQSGSGSSSTNGSINMPLSHLQDNAKAEREVSMILPDFLFLGGELIDEEQVEELEKLGIKRVLNMAVNCDDDLWVQRFGQSGYLKVGLRDHVDQDLKDGLDEAVKFIASSKTPIYVHCQAGKSRSVATVIGYLIQEHQWPLKRAYDHVVERRRCMSPNIGFVSQLILLEKRVLGSDKANGLVSVGNSDDLDPSSRTTVVSWMTS
ncbi:phosphatases II [Linnemannia elongata AG-77]|uniref:protein-tyrosine-phosphatase n=1 Tax=Linnemannia elongata AG-77 TaxID=1314771 RepID=A0A197JPA6_9FUNG|nr:phosphatases II [Linnemannia elongata AG-77]